MAEIAAGEQFCGTRQGGSWCLCMCLWVHECFILPGNKSRNSDNGVDISRDTRTKRRKEIQNELREQGRNTEHVYVREAALCFKNCIMGL